MPRDEFRPDPALVKLAPDRLWLFMGSEGVRFFTADEARAGKFGSEHGLEAAEYVRASDGPARA